MIYIYREMTKEYIVPKDNELWTLDYTTENIKCGWGTDRVELEDI